ncbi:hypothetical protein AWENTII_008667 [Aspergillus wentii]|nr:hypothetical protein MW887_005337 [Aspergillus wentii]
MASNYDAQYLHEDYTPSETESTLSSQLIYTPTSEDMNASKLSADDLKHIDMLQNDEEQEEEQAPFLNERPPEYEKVISGMPTDSKEGGGGENFYFQDEDSSDSNPRGNCYRGKKKNTRRGRCLLGLVRGFVLFGVLFWVYRLLGTIFRPPCAENPEQREITIDNGPQSIQGRYPLFDLLSLSTTTGDITVSVVPQLASSESPDEPARLRIRSTSGSVTVSFSAPAAASMPDVEMDMMMDDMVKEEANEKKALQSKRKNDKRGKFTTHNRLTNKQGCTQKGFFKWTNACKSHRKNKNKNKKRILPAEESNTDPNFLPLRPYEIDIQTETGSIAGRFLVSSSVHLVTGTGSINAVLVPVTSMNQDQGQDHNVSVTTTSEEGSQQIHLTEPFYADQVSSSLSSLSKNSPALGPNANSNSGKSDPAISHATHHSNRGSLQIAYPRQWAGSIHARSEGSVNVGGLGVDITKDSDEVVDGVKKSDTSDDERWWGSRMDVSLESSQGAVAFYVG